MTVEQIGRFINESIINKIQWKTIRVLGGEPTLHSKLVRILEMLNEYRIEMLPESIIQLVTNGYGRKVNETLFKVFDGIFIENSVKISRAQTTFYPFNIAPVDVDQFKNYDFSGGCWIAAECGMGLTPYGYYPCAIAGGIDRIFGFDQGRKELPGSDDQLLDLFSMFCRYCGHFMENQRRYSDRQPVYPAGYSSERGTKPGVGCGMMSPTWIRAYTGYRQKIPKLTRY